MICVTMILALQCILHHLPVTDRQLRIVQDGDDQPSEFSNTSLNHMMMKAYGATLLYSDGGSHNSQWC